MTIMPAAYESEAIYTLAEANERILGSLSVAGNAVKDAALTYAQVVTLELWKEQFNSVSEWERWLEGERQKRGIPRSTWAYWLRLVCYLQARGLEPSRLGQDFRPGAVYALSKADGYRRGQPLSPEAETSLPRERAEEMLVQAGTEADLPWTAYRPATEAINRLVRARQVNPDGVECWAGMTADGYATLYFKWLDVDGVELETFSVDVGMLPDWVAGFLANRLGAKELWR